MSNDRQEFETKVLEIQEWLESISGDLQNESYEINEFTVNYLYQLCQLNKKQDEHLQLMIKDNLDKAEEYSAENERMVKELEYLGIPQSVLDNKSVDTLSELADIGNNLSLTNPSLENYLMMLSDHTMEELEVKDKLKEQEIMLQSLSEKLEKLELETRKLSEETENKENKDSQSVDLPVEIETAKVQAQHYMETTKEFKKLLSASGIKKEYTHENLQKISEKVTALSTEIESTNKRVAAYKELPPSIPLAKDRVRQIKLEIDAMEREFPELSCG